VNQDSGTIVCAFYGYSTPDVGEKMPHGIFVSVFDEAWIPAETGKGTTNEHE